MPNPPVLPLRRRTTSATPLAIAALVLALLPALATPAQAQEADVDAAEAAAATWLVGAYADGEVTTGGGLADLIFALSGAQAAPDTVAAALTDLEALALDYAGGEEPDEGPLAKGLLGILAGGGDAIVDDVDLEAQLRGLMQTEGEDAGRFDDANVFSQSLAVMALAATDAGAPAEATTWLAERRCPDGGWTFGLADTFGDGTGLSIPCMESGAGDVDTTALAIQALLADDAQADARDGAVDWLLSQQADDGSFGDNANSTGLAAQALRAVGETGAADTAAQFVTTLQHGPDAEEPGAIAFTADDDGSLLLATTQGILAFGAPALPLLEAPVVPDTGGACVPGQGVTVVVDLTAFEGGEVITGCAPGDPASGLEALAAAGFDATTATTDFGEYVCAIDGLPELACDAPFEGQYWSYHAGNADGSWTASEIGADSTDPAPGDVEGWAWSDGAAPAIAAPGAVVDRIAGSTRIDTAIRASQDAFPGGFAPGAVITRADGFADALAGTPLALAVGGPLLTTPTDALPEEVLAEVSRAVAPGATVHVLGGEAAVGPAVATALEEAGFTVERLSGADRFTTAVAVVDAIAEIRGGLSQVLITTGGDFPDALAAGTAAAVQGDAAVLLTGDGTAHPAATAWLEANADVEAFAVGGPAVTAHPDATPIAGDSREATAVAVAEAFFDAPTAVGIARRDDFADALAGGVHIARQGGPLLITSTDGAAGVVTGYLCATPSVAAAVVYGGEAAVGQAASLGVADAITGDACA